jgi:hypothetical protein
MVVETPQQKAHGNKSKPSPRIGRILFVLGCFVIAIISLPFLWMIAFDIWPFSRSAETNSKSQPEIHTNETVRAVWDSGLSTERALSATYWLDNDTVLFLANNGPKPRTPEAIRTRETWLYLWRLGEKPQPYGADPRGAARGYYCAARGEVTYYQEIVDPKTGTISRIRWFGAPGHERAMAPLERPLDGKAAGIAANPLSVERTDCEIYTDPTMAGTHYVTDSEHGFYLDFGNDPIMAMVHAKPEQPIVLMRADGSGRVDLSISNAQAASGATHFHTFEGVFYLWNRNLTASPINHFALWRDTNCWPIWRVDPRTVNTKRFCIPFGPWSGVHGGATELELAPTKTGIFFAANSINAKDESGFYRLDNGIVSRIFPGNVWSSVVSPNGCRIAFTRPDDDHSIFGVFWSSIVVIDVCSPKFDGQPHSN